MDGISNPEDELVKKQQEDDLGHPEDRTDGAVHARIERLPEGVNADGMLPSGHLHGASDTEQQRRAAVDKARSAGRNGRRG